MPHLLSAFRYGFLVTAIILPACVFSAEDLPHAGMLLSIEKHVEVTPLEYVFEVVAASYDTVTYRLRIRAGAEVYDAEYAPDVQPDGPLPSEWRAGADIQFRIKNRQVIFTLASGREIVARLVGRHKS
jgi:hypothetical protein